MFEVILTEVIRTIRFNENSDLTTTYSDLRNIRVNNDVKGHETVGLSV